MATIYDGARLRSLEGLLLQWEHYLTWQSRFRLIWNRHLKRFGPFPRIESPALDNYDKLRSYLLSVHQRDPSLSRIDEFQWPEPLTESAAQDDLAIGLLQMVPHELARWSLCSRRVYHVSEELQAVLTATDFGDLTWNDVPLPHDSYAVQLERPIQLAGGDTSSLLLLSRFEASSPEDIRFTIRIIGDSSASFRRNDSRAEKKFASLLQKGKIPESCSVIEQQINSVRLFGSNYKMANDHVSISIQKVLNENAMNGVGTKVFFDESGAKEGDINLSLSVFDQAARILLGLAFYFKTLTNRESKPSDWRGVKNWGRPDHRVVTHHSKICHVKCHYVLSDIERTFLGLGDHTGQFDMSWKFVRGYWRRPAGKGNDPSAIKTVHVRPYMIRRDRMPNNGLPGGASQDF